MEVICLKDAAFYNLFIRVIKHIKEKPVANADRWISGDEAMKVLRISSKTRLHKIRDEVKSRFTQPEKKIFFYDTDSVN